MKTTATTKAAQKTATRNNIMGLVPVICSGVSSNEFGTKDYIKSGMPINAKAGQLSECGQYVCIGSDVTSASLKAYVGSGADSYWAKVADVAALTKKQVAINNLRLDKEDAALLNSIPANWDVLLKGQKAFENGAEYRAAFVGTSYSVHKTDSHVEIRKKSVVGWDKKKSLVCAVTHSGENVTYKVAKSE